MDPGVFCPVQAVLIALESEPELEKAWGTHTRMKAKGIGHPVHIASQSLSAERREIVVVYRMAGSWARRQADRRCESFCVSEMKDMGLQYRIVGLIEELCL